VTVGFFSFCCFPPRSAWRGTSGTTETRSHHSTEQWAISTLLCLPLSLFFFPACLFYLPLFLLGPCAPIHHRGAVSMAGSQGSRAEELKWSHHLFSAMGMQDQMKAVLLLSDAHTLSASPGCQSQTPLPSVQNEN